MTATTQSFQDAVNRVTSQPGYRQPIAFGVGIRRQRHDQTLDVLFPKINWKTQYEMAALFQSLGDDVISSTGFYPFTKEALQDAWQYFSSFHAELEKKENVLLIKSLLGQTESSSTYFTQDAGVFFLFEDHEGIQSVEDGYFRLQCLSQRCVKPHSINLDGLFGTLPNIAWSNHGPILPSDVDEVRIQSSHTNHPLLVTHVDKFPYLVNYHIPSNVRIASGSQVRLGAYLGEGTTVMPAGYVNFNAGTEGVAMVEGRISAGVVVGHQSDLGGGASIMGTLSGGNDRVISIGDQCLLGANSGAGISLGRGCTIAAGLYVVAGAKVALVNDQDEPIDIAGQRVNPGDNIVKAAELSGRDYLLFIQDSRTGQVICKPNTKVITLNKDLHTND